MGLEDSGWGVLARGVRAASARRLARAARFRAGLARHDAAVAHAPAAFFRFLGDVVAFIHVSLLRDVDRDGSSARKDGGLELVDRGGVAERDDEVPDAQARYVRRRARENFRNCGEGGVRRRRL